MKSRAKYLYISNIINLKGPSSKNEKFQNFEHFWLFENFLKNFGALNQNSGPTENFALGLRIHSKNFIINFEGSVLKSKIWPFWTLGAHGAKTGAPNQKIPTDMKSGSQNLCNPKIWRS